MTESVVIKKRQLCGVCIGGSGMWGVCVWCVVGVCVRSVCVCMREGAGLGGGREYAFEVDNLVSSSKMEFYHYINPSLLP